MSLPNDKNSITPMSIANNPENKIMEEQKTELNKDIALTEDDILLHQNPPETTSTP